MADAPILNLEVVQRGIEATPGTLVAATHRVPFEPGSAELHNTIDRIRRRNSGSLATSHSSSSGLTHAALQYDERATFDFLAVNLASLLAPTVTGTGAGADKTWAFTPSDSVDNLKRASLELGGRDTWPAEEHIAGAIIRAWELTWDKTGEDWMQSIEWIGIRSTQAAKAGALTLPTTLVPILAKATRCYIDPTTFGSTSYGRALSGRIRVELETSERFGTDGNDYANRIAVLKRTVTASVVAEYDATTLRDAWRNGTLQKLRIANTGPSLGGSTYSAILDIPGTWETSDLGDDGGIITLEHELTAEYNATLTADISATIVNSIAAIP